MRALPVVGLVLVVVLLASLAWERTRRARRAGRARWRVAPPLPPRDGAAAAMVVDIAPYVARRELVEGAIAVAALARQGAIARHSERDRRAVPVAVVDIASRRRPAVAAVRGAPQEAPAPRRSGTTVAQSTRITGSPSIEHLA